MLEQLDNCSFQTLFCNLHAFGEGPELLPLFWYGFYALASYLYRFR